MGVKYTMRVIRETHEAWKKLVKTSNSGSSEGLAHNLSVPSLESLDMDSDHVAVNALLGPEGTPRILDPAQVAQHFPLGGAMVTEAAPAVVHDSRSATPQNAEAAIEF